MVLVLVVHTLEAITATVPMSMILLSDCHAKKKLPEGLRLRMTFPSSGAKSVSIWDAKDTGCLIDWLTATLGQGVEHEAFEVVEDFSLGIAGQLSQARTSEKMQEKTLQAVHAATSQFEKIDEKFMISERTEKTLEIAKIKSTEVLQKMATSAGKAKTKAMENPTMSSAVTSVNQGIQTGWKSMEKGLDWAVQKISKTHGSKSGGQKSPSSASSEPVIPNMTSTRDPVEQQAAQDKNPAEVRDTPQTRQDVHDVSPDAVFSLDEDDTDNPGQTGT